ncbi:hypothetical protein JCM24511_09418 [Saitozyma sp. JCM 24511]|nr:hypothetical protein JCM24511_09418 [Saitozyma sp. JCM 24511]
MAVARTNRDGLARCKILPIFLLQREYQFCFPTGSIWATWSVPLSVFPLSSARGATSWKWSASATHWFPGFAPFDPAPPYQSTAGGEMQPKPENNVQLDKIRKTQAELQEVTRLMEENIMATQQRGEMMDHLQVKTDNLAVQSKTFRTQAAVVRRKMWWKNFKWWILLTLLLILIVGGAIAGAVNGKEAVESAATATTTTTAAADAAALTSGTEIASASATATG